MSSRRKSSVPCLVRVFNNLPEEGRGVETLADNDVKEKPRLSTEKSQEQEEPEHPEQQVFPEHEDQLGKSQQPPVIEDVEAGEKDEIGADSDPKAQKKPTRGHDCKSCPFSTQNVSEFKARVDSSRPNVVLNPLDLCAVCTFTTKTFDRKHPGETNVKFQRTQINNQTVLEQTIEGRDPCVSVSPPRPPTTVRTSSFQGDKPKSLLNGLIQKDPITAVLPEAAVLGLQHATPMLRRPPNFPSLPKIAVPLNATKYNPSLDDNLTLITSFNTFPYPTHAELAWLTAASKHPGEQIRVWFTAQRLKQGITWSPEEVEEARKKMFNGSIPVVMTSRSSQSSVNPPRQTLVHTPIRRPGRVQTTASSADPPPGVSIGSSLSLKRTHLTTGFGPDSKRPIMAVAPQSGDPKDGVLMAPPPPPPPQKDRLPTAPPPVPMDVKRPVAVSRVGTEIKRSSATLPSSSSSSSASSLSNGTVLSKIGMLVSLPPVVFPESVTRPGAPPFKNVLVSLTSAIPSKEKHPDARAAPAADSSPLISPQIRSPTHISGFPFENKKLREQQRLGLGGSPPAGDKVRTPMAEANGVSGMEDEWLPLLERMKGKTAEQLNIWEDVDDLAGPARLSQRETHGWFVERRALQDDLEQARLISVGTKRVGSGAGAASSKKGTLQRDGPLKGPPPPSQTSTTGSNCPSMATLQGDLTRWPRPEGRTGPARSNDRRLHSSSLEPAERSHNSGVNGGQRPPGGSPEGAPPSTIEPRQEGAPPSTIEPRQEGAPPSTIEPRQEGAPPSAIEPRQEGAPPSTIEPRQEGAPPSTIEPRQEGAPPSAIEPRQEGAPPSTIEPRQEGAPPSTIEPRQEGAPPSTIEPRQEGAPPSTIEPRQEGAPPSAIEPRQEGAPPSTIEPRQEGAPPSTIEPRQEGAPPSTIEPRQEGAPPRAIEPRQEGAPPSAIEPRQEGAPPSTIEPRQEGAPPSTIEPRQEGAPPSSIEPRQEGAPPSTIEPRQEGAPPSAIEPRQEGAPPSSRTVFEVELGATSLGSVILGI
ncbi:zinc fingers and homeoboxes protein 2-like [Brachionichthys hirsutus]|uniref:zinc fingers and homeoboxes protein 2-like n=1 Tax=Brachionichthys hirsutus TaxID=412623 RepID=UPI0036053B51